MKKNKILTYIIVLVAVCFVGFISALIQFLAINPSKDYAYESIQFSYDGASEGKDLNGNAYDPIDFMTEEVVLKGLKDAGFEGKYNIDDVKACLSLQGYVPKNIISEITSFDSLVDGSAVKKVTSSLYYPTNYSFVLYDDFDNKISKDDTKKILDSIVNAYIESFYDYYNVVYDTTDIDLVLSKDTDDYVYQLQAYYAKLTILNEYATDLYERHPDYVLNGMSFNDISLKCESLYKNDISKLSYSIAYNALSKDLDRLNKYYNYRITKLNYSKTKYNSDLANITTLLAGYSKDSTIYISSRDNVIQVDSNSKETYDKLLNEKIEISTKIAEINKQIKDYQNKIDDINSASATSSEYVLVESNLEKLKNEYNTLLAKFNELVNGYNDKYVLNNTVSNTEVKYHSNSVISASFIVQCIKSVGPLFMVAMLVILCIEFVCIIKKEKNNKILA